MSSPLNMIRPLVGRSTPVRQLKKVDFPAPLGPMIPRIWPAGTLRETLVRAASPPKRTVSASVFRSGDVAVSVDTRATETRSAPGNPGRRERRGVWGAIPGPPMSLRELACRRDDRLLLGNHVHDLVLVVLDREDELAEERLVVFLSQRLVALREVVALLDLHTLQGLDQLHRVFPAAETGLLDPELHEIHGLEVRLDIAVRQRTGRIDLLERGDGLIEELPMVWRVQRSVEHRHVAVDADESLDLLAQRRQVRGLRDGAVACELVLLGEPEVVDRAGEVDGVRAEEDPEETVEAPADLRDEWSNVGGAQRHAGGADDLAAVLLDLFDVCVARGLAPRVVEEGDVPLLAHLPDQVRGDRHRLGWRVVEGTEHETAALGRGDRGVQADTDHPDRPVLLEDRHAGQADVGEVPALGDVDLVLEDELLGLAAAHVWLRLVVGNHQLDGATVDAARLVDPLDGHLGADQRGLAAGRGSAGERLENADLVRFGLPECLPPRRRNQHGRAEGAGRRRREREELPPGRLAAPPHVLRPGFVVPALCHSFVLPGRVFPIYTNWSDRARFTHDHL